MAEAYQKLGRYLLTEEIASGGMAVVYRAKLVGIAGFEKEFAVKKILPEWSHDEHFTTMLVNEAKVLVPLHHGNIVQVFELGQDRDAYFIVMEYVDGFDLRRVLQHLKANVQKLPPELYGYIALEVCRGLEFAHERRGPTGAPLGLVHRDVSPQNILVSRDGQVKITDFGIAKIPGKSTETRAGTLKGKFAYMSPEQASGRTVDARTDVFALGAVLYEMAVGEKCFDGANDLEILDKVRRAEVRFPNDLDPRLQNILTNCLARDPAARYAATRELRRELEVFVSAQPARADAHDLQLFLKSLFGESRLAQNTGVREKTAKTLIMPAPSDEAAREFSLASEVMANPTNAGALSNEPAEAATVISEKTVLDDLPTPPALAVKSNHDAATVDMPADGLDFPAAPAATSSRRFSALVIGFTALAVTLALSWLSLPKKEFKSPTQTTPAVTKVTAPLAGVTDSSPAPSPAAMATTPDRLQPAPAPPLPVSARVELTTVPAQAEIRYILNGKEQVTTGTLIREFPFNKLPLAIPITVSHPDYHAQSLTIDLTATAATAKQSVTLAPLGHGVIRITKARPWGKASLEGYGQKNVPADFKVTEGTHHLRVESLTPFGKRVVMRTLTVAPDQTIVCTASFAQPPKLVCK